MGNLGYLMIGLAAGVPAAIILFLLMGVRWISNSRIGVVEKTWSTGGSVASGFIALNGEAGYQPQVLRGGIHWLMPFQYRVHTLPLVTIPQGRIGYVFARDGKGLEPTQTLASNIHATNFEDVQAFLKAGGQRGPQRKILREGTYAFNLAQFVVITEERLFGLILDANEAATFNNMRKVIYERDGFQPIVIKGADDEVGVVTIHDGPALPDGQIIAPIVGNNPADASTYHNNFQDPERFLASGGRRGRQLQVLVDGTYALNRLFGTVEMVKKTIIEVGNVGVVVSYTGNVGKDLSGTEYKHGELVGVGERGVWAEPMLPGKYAFNTYAGKIIVIPTTNFVLKWIKAEAGAHRFDENLSEVRLITKDAFEPSLPLSVVVHIDYKKAPLVIQRFGDIRKLVEQTLDPMVAAYFKNVGQNRTLIQLLQDRSFIQEQAGSQMKEKFAHYNLELEEVLIGTPSSVGGDNRIEQILTQLRMRQVAEEQVETYSQQEKAAGKERELREAEARAKQQTALTESELQIIVQTNQGKAEYQRSMQKAQEIKTMYEAEAGKVRTLADAEGSKIRMLADAEASKIAAIAESEALRAAKIGIAQAIAIEEQVRAYGGPQFQLTQQVMNRFAEALQESKVDIVPKIVIGGGSGGNGQPGGQVGSPTNLIEGLLTLMMSEKLGVTSQTLVPRTPEVQAMVDKMKQAGVPSATGTPPPPKKA